MARVRVSLRLVALMVAIVLAGVATVALFSYVRGLEAEALQDAETVQAYVATDRIPAGTSAQAAVNQGLIVEEPVARRFLVDGAISSLTQLDPDSVAVVDIQPGEQILAARFAQPGTAAAQAGTGVRLDIPEDRQAISVQVGIPPGVAGFVTPGAVVSLIAQLEVQGGAEPGNRVQFLVQNVEVLAVGRRVVTQTDQGVQEQVQVPQDQVLLTLAVSPADAEKIAYAVFQGDLYFTLLPELDEYPTHTTPGRTDRNAFN